MKIKLFALLYLFFFFAGCQLGEKQGSGMSDAELVQLIIAAQKEQISVSELPAKSILYLESDIEYDEIETHIALELGYEVKRIGNGSRIGHRNEVYFNLEGRKLDPTNWNCKREDWEISGEHNERKERDDWRCFYMVFPVTFVMPDGSTVTVSSDDESGWSELKSWYEINEGEEEPSLQYPVEIIRDTEQGEETIVINSEEELAEIKEACRDYIEDSDDSEDCFEYLYPVTFIMPDGSTITVQNEDGLLILHRWYEENSGYEEEPVLQYPVSVVLETEEGETTLVVNSETEIDMIYENCELDE